MAANSPAPPSVQAEAARTIRDVAMQAGNVLHGNVVGVDGMAQADHEMWIAPDNGPAQRFRTDAIGRFAIPDLRPGVYRIDTASGGGRFRVWEAKDAPSTAPRHLLLVVGLK